MPISESPSRITLSAEQKRIVTHGNGHLQVITCAGSGKTEAISQRVSKLIDTGAEPAEIVAFTFTDRAAASIFKRVAESKGEAFLERLGPMYVGTIHAFCFRLLQDHVPKFANFDLLDEHRLAGMLSREYKRLHLDRLDNRHWRPILEFQRNADVVENELIDVARLRGTTLGECYADFLDMLQRYKLLTYGQLIAKAVNALDDPAIAQRVRRNLRHLIVDEYQDINPAQERLIQKLGSSPVQVCVVGDDDQAIYQWRGSEFDNILTFSQRYRGTKSLSLSQNRRSRPASLSPPMNSRER